MATVILFGGLLAPILELKLGLGGEQEGGVRAGFRAGQVGVVRCQTESAGSSNGEALCILLAAAACMQLGVVSGIDKGL